MRGLEHPRVGIDLGGTKIEAALMDATGALLERRRVPTPRGDYAGTLTAIAGLVGDLEREAGAPVRVGVAMPGAISPHTARVQNSNSTVLNGMPLDTDLAARLDRPVRFANDADCFALSEAVDGAAAGAETVFGVILGTGVGGGIVVRRQLLAGPNAIAGEWGHNPLPWPTDDERPGPACYCGREGCIETFLSGPALVADYQRCAAPSAPALADVEALLDAANTGNRGALAAIERHTERLARALATVINLLDPEVIVLGGGLSNMASLYSHVPTLWTRWVFAPAVRTRLIPPRHGDSSGVRGAAWLWPANPDQRLPA